MISSKKRHHPAEIDVIIPVFNGAKYIADALQSVQRQTLPAKRIIVANDGSTDGTEEIVSYFARNDERILLLNLEHAGVSAARNAGILRSSAEFLAFLDADDIWLPDKLKLQTEIFTNCNQKTGFVHSSYFYIDEMGNYLKDKKVFPPIKSGDVFMLLLLGGYVMSGSASSVIVRRDVLDLAGYFDEQLFYGEDWDLWIRLASISHVNFTTEAIVGIRVNSQSAQRRVRPLRELEFFQQKLLIYSKWESVLCCDRLFKVQLRMEAIDVAISIIRSPSLLSKFCMSLLSSESKLVKSIFRNRIHFWLEICFRVFIIVCFRLKNRIWL